MSNHREEFERLYSYDVTEYVERKNGLAYLSWAWAWAEFKQFYPDATYEVKKDECGLPYFGDPDIGYMVYTSVTAGDLTYEMWLPVMDNNNKSLKAQPYTFQTKSGERTVEAMTMFDVNKAVMRCLVKNLAMFGLGLYIYAGEDLPEDIKTYKCECCGRAFEDFEYKGKKYTAATAYEQAKKLSNGKALCRECRNNKTESEV